MITVDEYPLGMNIVYDIRADTRDEVYNYLVDLEHRYHPEGYGTRLSYIQLHTDTNYWYARITRSQSCD